MKFKDLFLALLFSGAISLPTLDAQQSLNSSGGEAKGSGGTLSYSLGNVVYTSHEGQAGSISLGVQQSFVISEIKTGSKLEEANFLKLYPNPAKDIIYLEVKDFDGSEIQYKLYDQTGKIIQTGNILSNQTPIITQYLKPAIYFLKLTRNDLMIKHFKIIKK